MNGTFDALVEKVAGSVQRPRASARLRIATEPTPFVAPGFHDRHPSMSAEVLFIEASAAVGKTTMARALSARTGAALLDLAEVPVSTQSMVGLLQSDFAGSSDPAADFHAGHLPIIIDALDEGRLLSGERSFEQFLVTTGELLCLSRDCTDRPKLIFFGRPDSISLAEMGLQLGCSEFTSSRLQVEFFGEETARKLIDAYARLRAAADSPYMRHPEPVKTLVDAYFAAIESALDLSDGQLWTNDRGRAFAGYAPVLAAVGSLLAEMDNFAGVADTLRSQGAKHAWSVIESVLNTILSREQKKLTEKLEQRIGAAPPAEAYDADEQLTLLTRLMHGQSLLGTGRVALPSADLATYYTMVEQYLPEHPFVRDGKPANVVLGSLVLAHAVYRDLLQATDMTLLGAMARQPFLWRSFSRRLTDEAPLIDGRYLGYILCSFWNDPLASESRITARPDPEQEGGAQIQVPHEGGHISIAVTLPLSLYATARRCALEVDDFIELLGQPASAGAAIFSFHGPVEIMAAGVRVHADAVTFEGDVWIEASAMEAPPRLDLQPKKGARLGWAGEFSATYPWNRIPSILPAPYSTPPADVLESLVDECQRRLPTSATITLDDRYKPENDRRLLWVDRLFPSQFPEFIKLLEKHGLVSTDPISAAGQAKQRVRFNLAWPELRRALRQPVDGQGAYAAFIAEARQRIR